MNCKFISLPNLRHLVNKHKPRLKKMQGELSEILSSEQTQAENEILPLQNQGKSETQINCTKTRTGTDSNSTTSECTSHCR